MERIKRRRRGSRPQGPAAAKPARRARRPRPEPQSRPRKNRPEKRDRLRRHTHTWTAAGLVALMAAMILTAATEVAAQGVNLRGKTRLNLGGTATFGDTTGATAIAGVSRFTEGGYEFGGDIWGYFSRHSTSATVLVRAGRNFIGESRTVPFVTGGPGSASGLSGRVPVGRRRRLPAVHRRRIDVDGRDGGLARRQPSSGPGNRAIRTLVLLRRLAGPPEPATERRDELARGPLTRPPRCSGQLSSSALTRTRGDERCTTLGRGRLT